MLTVSLLQPSSLLCTPVLTASNQGSALLTQKQVLWVESLKAVYKTMPAVMIQAPASQNWLRRRLYDLVVSTKFEVRCNVRSLPDVAAV